MNQVYTREQLESLKRPQLWQICETFSLPKYPASAKCVDAILEKQPVKIEVAVTSATSRQTTDADLQRLANNQQGYQDAVKGLDSRSDDPCYQVGYARGRRDATPLPREDKSLEAITFEKIGTTIYGGKWSANIDGTTVTIAAVQGGYKTSVTSGLFIDFGTAVKQALLFVSTATERQIASECDRLGLEYTEDGIYQGNLRLGEVGCSEGNWWVVRTSGQPTPCDGAVDAVCSLMADADFVLLNPQVKRVERAATIEVLEQHGDKFVVHNPENGHHYVVNPNLPNPKERCECADCYYRAATCKHQIAVETFLRQRLEDVVVSFEDLLDMPFNELTSEQWEWLKEHDSQEASELVAA